MILTLAEAAAYLHCSRKQLSNAIRGKIPDIPPLPALRIGRTPIIRGEALEQWLKDLESQAVERRYASGLFTYQRRFDYDLESIGGA